MMKINTSDWITFVGNAKNYLDEANIVLTEGKAEIVGIDLTHTNMIQAVLNCDCDVEGTIPISTEKMLKALGAVGPEAELEVKDGYVILYGQHTKIKVPLLAFESNFKWPPTFSKEPAAYCDIDPSLLAPMVSYGQYAKMGIAKVAIQDTRMVITVGEHPETSEIQAPNTAVGNSTSILDLQYIELLMKILKGTDNVTVCGYADGNPILFKWTAGNGEYKVLMAPRVED